MLKIINFLAKGLKFTILTAIILLPYFGLGKAYVTDTNNKLLDTINLEDPIAETTLNLSQWDFYIKNFHVEVKINKDSTINVNELIEVDFIDPKHGIFREIPTIYGDSWGLKRNIFINDINVNDEKGKPLPFAKSNSNGVLSIKIGDPTVTVSGSNTYVISYKVKNAFEFFKETEEIFWNITGNAWPVPIVKASGSFELPHKFENLKTVAFFGPLHSTQRVETFFTNNKIEARVENLEPGEGLSIASSWQKGTLVAPSRWQFFQFFMIANWWLMIPIIILIFSLWFLIKFAIDPKGRGTIIPEFAIPKEINLLESSALYDEHFQTKDLTALIISWAVDGFIVIRETQKKALFGNKSEFTLIKKKKITGRSKYETDFYNFLFSNKAELKMKDIEPTKFNVELGKMKNSVFVELKNKGFFANHPEKTRIAFYIFGSLVMILSLIGIGFYNLIGPLALISTFISGLFLILLAPLSPKRTLKGVMQKQKIQGFELFLKTAERYRLKWQEQEKIFEQYLPYAIALGVANIWASHFKDKFTKAPDWYSGYNVTHFDSVNFTNSINSNFGSVIASTITQAQAHSGGSSFGGGGFSGGGVGGGGGGSW